MIRDVSGTIQSECLLDKTFDGILASIHRNPVNLLAIPEQENRGTERHIIAFLELCFCIKIQSQQSNLLVFRLLPQFVERQDLAPADRSPRCIDVDDHRLVGGELLVEIRLVIDVVFDDLREGGRCHRSEKQHHQCDKFSHAFKLSPSR
jgi:hypothetical protein